LVYMVFLQLKKQLGVDSYVKKDCQDYVKAFFEPEVATSQLPVLSEVYCNPEDIKSRLYGYNGHFRDLLNDEKWRKGKLIEFYPSTKDNTYGYKPEEHVCPEQEAFNRAYVKHLRKHMPFRDNLQEKINRRLKSVAKKHYKDKKVKDVTFVGVHVRRTDHLRFMRQNYGLEPLDADYYNNAMEYFQEEYDNCVFVVASDDIKWTKKNLDRKNNIIYFSDQNPTFHRPSNTMYELMDDDLSKSAFDFALIVSCNHTITSRGTYSMWLALLTPGEYMTEFGAIVTQHDYE